MKHLIVFILACIIGLIVVGFVIKRVPVEYLDYNDIMKVTDEETEVRVAPATVGATFDDLLDAIEWVESKGDPWAKGDWNKMTGEWEAIGAYQIHKIYVDDVNRWQGLLVQFTYKDRYDKKSSRGMVKIFLKHYGGTLEEMARKHNGGPQGHKKESTVKYWNKVKARLERNEK